MPFSLAFTPKCSALIKTPSTRASSMQLQPGYGYQQAGHPPFLSLQAELPDNQHISLIVFCVTSSLMQSCLVHQVA